MSEPGRFNAARLWEDYGQRLLKYGGVTVVSTCVGLSTFALGLYVFDWPPEFANFVSVCMSTPPAYVLNRHWVWEQDPGGHSVAKEIGPFWMMTILGFVVSTVAVGIADEITDKRILLLLTQVGAFGTLWLVKFVILEKVLWHDGQAHVHERV